MRDDLMEHAEISSMLGRQAECWNRGELERYLSFYAQDGVYVSADGTLLCGRDAIGQSLVLIYGFSDTPPGSLSYSDLFVRVISPDLAIAFGRYHLGGGKRGFFSLVLRYDRGIWEILLDHPSYSNG